MLHGNMVSVFAYNRIDFASMPLSVSLLAHELALLSL